MKLKRLKIQDMQDQIEEQLKFLVEADSSEANLINFNTVLYCRLCKDSNSQVLFRLIKIFVTIQRNLILLEQYRSAHHPLFGRRHRDVVQTSMPSGLEVTKRVLIEHFQ